MRRPLAGRRFVDPRKLSPRSEVRALRVLARPTLNFSSMVEDVVKVGATFYSAYTRKAPGAAITIRLASTTDLYQAWTDLGEILTLGSQTWENSTYQANGCCLMEDGGTFYLFYASGPEALDTGESADIGVATASSVTGPYTKSASNPILVRGSSGAWDDVRVQEPSVIRVGDLWIMAYMGEANTSYGLTEQIGAATASDPEGPWTKVGTDGLVIAQPSGLIVADPSLFHEDGLLWCYYVEADATATFADSFPYFQVLSWAEAPEGPWTRLETPILEANASASFEAGGVWRGGLFREGRDYWITYAGMGTDADPATAKSSTARLEVWAP